MGATSLRLPCRQREKSRQQATRHALGFSWVSVGKLLEEEELEIVHLALRKGESAAGNASAHHYQVPHLHCQPKLRGNKST